MKPPIVYHGSLVPDIEELKPKKRYTPGVLGDKAKPAIYAAADPAYAAGHSFEWTSDEGFDIYEYKDKVTLIVPKKFEERLNQKICIYSLPSENFHLLQEDTPKAEIYLSLKNVKPIGVKCFKSVKEAFKFYNGIIKIQR